MLHVERSSQSEWLKLVPHHQRSSDRSHSCQLRQYPNCEWCHQRRLDAGHILSCRGFLKIFSAAHELWFGRFASPSKRETQPLLVPYGNEIFLKNSTTVSTTAAGHDSTGLYSYRCLGIGPTLGTPSSSFKRPSTSMTCGSAMETTWTFTRSIMVSGCITGWWLTYPSEKYESIGMMKFPICGKIENVPNHQPDFVRQNMGRCWSWGKAPCFHFLPQVLFARAVWPSGTLVPNRAPHHRSQRRRPATTVHILGPRDQLFPLIN